MSTDDFMTPEQERHLDDLKDDFIDLLDPKYRTGAAEHKTILKEASTEKLLAFAMEEVVDLYVYLRTLQQKIEEGDVTINE